MDMRVTAESVEVLGRRYSALQLRLAALQGRAKELNLQKTKLATSIALAKARQELSPQATEVFDYLQERAHARAVGEFEDLLTAAVSDVVPGAGKIRFELGTERGAPALDIMLDNGGDLENILEGNGGGLTNVVVTGLGFAALARTRNRQLMVLDEPDCWLKAKNVPAFTKVIAEVSNPRPDGAGVLVPGCQTLMVSHNDVTLMDDGAHIQDLRKDMAIKAFAARLGVSLTYVGDPSDCAYVVWVPGKGEKPGGIEVRYRNDGWGDDEQNALTQGFPFVASVGGARAWTEDLVGVRWIEAENLRRHVFTRLELSPGLNVLTGDVNDGKSTLYFTVLRALAYGESDDTMIRHGADAYTVRVGLENNVVLEATRTRKGAPKVIFRRFVAGVLVNEGRPETRGSVPEFISDSLRVSRIDGLDVQLRSQKQPVFLLNETPARRAQILSIGRESGLLQKLIERHRLQVRRDKELLKHEEVELNLVNRTLGALAPLGAISALEAILDELLVDLRNGAANLLATRAAVAKLEPLASRVTLAGRVEGTLAKVPSAPECTDAHPLLALLDKLAKFGPATQLKFAAAVPVAPEAANTIPLYALLARLEKTKDAEALLAVMARAATLVSPVFSDTAGLRKDGVRLAQQVEAIGKLQADEKAVMAEELAAQTALHDLKHKLGVCPTCNQEFKE